MSFINDEKLRVAELMMNLLDRSTDHISPLSRRSRFYLAKKSRREQIHSGQVAG